MSASPRVLEDQPTLPAHHLAVPYLRSWRCLAGLTQLEVSRRAGLVPNTVSRIEGRHAGTARTVVKLAQALGVSVAQLRSVDPLAEPGPTTPSAA
jgi:transcriptional regulator with XRE-family HTH domain